MNAWLLPLQDAPHSFKPIQEEHMQGGQRKGPSQPQYSYTTVDGSLYKVLLVLIEGKAWAFPSIIFL